MVYQKTKMIYIDDIGDLGLVWGFSKNAHLTFPVNDGEVGVGGAYAKDELVSDEGFVGVDSTYCLNQLWKTEQSMRQERKTKKQAHISLQFFFRCFL